jgi:gamma-glutamylcyclotransferase (GGCT)/AIG2-like uncharacterized protein YtfP
MQQSLVFVDGMEGGPLKQFYADGTLALSCSFNKGLLDGDWEKFSPTGQLESRGGYSKGERDGAWKELYPEVNGFFWEGKYEKDKKEGVWEVQNANGFVHQKETFQTGSLVEISEFTAESGLVLDAAGDDIVGEVYSVDLKMLGNLDAFEGVSAGETEDSEYRRVHTTVTRADGEILSAWVWEWLGAVDERQRLGHGDWLA